MLVLLAAFVAASCGDGGDRDQSGRAGSDFGGRASSPAEPSSQSVRSEDADVPPESVGVEDAVRPLRLAVRSRTGYFNGDGELVLDVLEGDPVYPTLVILDSERRRVRGVRPTITPQRDSRVISMAGEADVSDASGEYPFGLMAGTMGEERVEIRAGDAGGWVILNVISRRAAGYGWLDDIEGALDWDLLFEADVQWGERAVSATFPEEVTAKSGQTVKLAGFVMPLEPASKQSHFLLTSSPPGCFFHVPGGPAGAVEVFATKPLEAGWDPVVLEGRFEALASSEIGVVYRLHEARALDLERGSFAQ